ncbi:MAG: hypothetical protein KDI74_14185 [Gammaproteobacteria bacterium]|nr:hypothetical protein [Gammaproteobacteria bacterium]
MVAENAPATGFLHAYCDARTPASAVEERLPAVEKVVYTADTVAFYLPGYHQNPDRHLDRGHPGLHFAVHHSESPQFAVVPRDGRWREPNALYRGKARYDSLSLKALPDTAKEVPVPVMFLDGAVESAGTRLIRPYACKRA